MSAILLLSFHHQKNTTHNKSINAPFILKDWETKWSEKDLGLETMPPVQH